MLPLFRAVVNFSGVKNWNDIPCNIREQSHSLVSKRDLENTFRTCKTQTRPLGSASILLYLPFFFLIIVTSFSFPFSTLLKGVIHLVRTHKGGGGQVKSVRHAYKGEVGLHMEVRTQKRPFLHVFCDIFICWKLLPYFCCLWRRLSLLFYKTLALIIFLSLTRFSVYSSMEIFIGYLKTSH